MDTLSVDRLERILNTGGERLNKKWQMLSFSRVMESIWDSSLALGYMCHCVSKVVGARKLYRALHSTLVVPLGTTKKLAKCALHHGYPPIDPRRPP